MIKPHNYFLVVFIFISSFLSCENRNPHKDISYEEKVDSIYYITNTFKEYDNLNSFKGIKFGSDFREVNSKLKLIKNKEFENGYVITNKNYLRFCYHDFESAHAFFINGKLSNVNLHYDSMKVKFNSYTNLYADLKEIYGNKIGKLTTGHPFASWNGTNISIELFYDFDLSGKGQLVVGNIQLMEQGHMQTIENLEKERKEKTIPEM